MTNLATILFYIVSVGRAIPQVRSEQWIWSTSENPETDTEIPARYPVNENLRNDRSKYEGQSHGPSSTVLHKGILVGPGGPTGVINRPIGSIGSSSLPPRIKDRENDHKFDTCLCRYSFNCPSPGLQFGACSGNKKYCCFHSRKNSDLLTGHYESGYHPSRPNSRYDNNHAPMSSHAFSLDDAGSSQLDSYENFNP